MEAPTENASDPLKSLRAERYREIRETESLLEDGLNSVQYIYFLLEPDKDVIRYIGICTHPCGRYSNHLQVRASSKTPVSRWITKLKQSGTLPRMWVIGQLTAHHWSLNINVNVHGMARAIEKMLIGRCIRGGYFGNGHLKSSLLNVEYVPQKILPDGLDVAKDRV